MGRENSPTTDPEGSPGTPTPVEALKAAFRAHPAGLAVLTAGTVDDPLAMTLSSVTSVSLHPPTVVWSLSKQSSTSARMLPLDDVVIHLLTADDLEVGRHFSLPSRQREPHPEWWAADERGTAYLPQVGTRLTCRVSDRHSAGDSFLVLGEVLSAVVPEEAAGCDSLIYRGREFRTLPASAERRFPRPKFFRRR